MPDYPPGIHLSDGHGPSYDSAGGSRHRAHARPVDALSASRLATLRESGPIWWIEDSTRVSRKSGDDMLAILRVNGSR